MKIVKMHKGSREAFDDFIEQRLNEVEVDNDMADKYFADINLPVPVIPTIEKSFFAKYKNIIGLLLLLISTSFVGIYVATKSKNIAVQKTIANKKDALQEKQHNIVIDKKSGRIDSATLVKEVLSTNENTPENGNGFSQKRNNTIVTSANKNIATVVADNFNNSNSKKKSYKLNNNFLQNKNAITKASDDNVIDVDKIISKQIDIDNNSIKSITIKPIKKEKQVEVKNADSLYIIW